MVDKTQCAGVNEDDWHSVTDAKKRKQIQDRLAQRSRIEMLRFFSPAHLYLLDSHHEFSDPLIADGIGKRLREAKKVEKQAYSQLQPLYDTQIGEQCPCSSKSSMALMSLERFSMTPCSGDITLPSTSQSPSHDPLSLVEKTPSLAYEVPYQLTLVGAMFINGQILGLSCCTVIPAKSPPAKPNVPLPLHPTATQMLTIHSTGIDRFPFPKLRDNLINLNSIIDEEEITRDLFLTPSFTISAGAQPWDPRAWKIEKPFADKWGYLFY
ncbi:uncharacterized protein PAC_04985 [Phialocephala subalpina]|uniref:Uncharacterized protein n=1 Tax=Phialocephala subalpina TaxID=576137 RepID=A0A1L7WQQ9_9HELO|nr:uncharacterized protein PAC_04985 [Phialocephala subalpina]